MALFSISAEKPVENFFDGEEEEREEQIEPKWSSSQKNVGIDLGYGFVKLIKDRENIVIPSVVGSGNELIYGSRIGKERAPLDNLMLEYEGKKYFVGSLAARHSNLAVRSLDSNRVSDRNTKVLLLTALSLLPNWDEQDYNLVTGLPTDSFTSYRGRWEEEIQGNYEVSLFLGKEQQKKKFKVNNVEIIPQPFGTLYDHLLDARGKMVNEDIAEEVVGIVDIGFKTTDFAVADQLEFVDYKSRSSSTALYDAYRLLSRRLREKFQVEKEDYELDSIIRKGSIRIAGEKHDLKPLLNDIYQQLAERLVVEIDSIWDYREFDIILLTGGGSKVLADYLRPRYPNMRLVENPQHANVTGYQKLALSE